MCKEKPNQADRSHLLEAKALTGGDLWNSDIMEGNKTVWRVQCSLGDFKRQKKVLGIIFNRCVHKVICFFLRYRVRNCCFLGFV